MSLAILTATRNNPALLSALRLSLEQQTSKDFTWHISVPSPSDSSLDALRNCKIDIVVNSQSDSGIYSALNQLIKELPSSSYYIVAGDDDIFASNSIETFLNLISLYNFHQQNYIFTSNVVRSGLVLKPQFRSSPYLVGQMKFVAAHSLATCIPKAAHLKYGLYDEHYLLAADEKFLLSCYLDPNFTFKHSSFISGQLGDGGVSRIINLDLFIESMKAKAFSLNHNIVALVYSLKLFKFFLFHKSN